MEKFPVTEKTEITRLAKRGAYDKETVYAILDEALFCTLAYVREGQPFQIPTGFARIGDKIYIHGSVGSFYMRELRDKKHPCCISTTLMDGLVLARAAMHHSVNYRSVVIFAEPSFVSDEHEQYAALEVFTEKICKGRWNDIRKPNHNEWKQTMVLSFEISEVSAKIRIGPPKDDEEDYGMDVWAGVVPLKIQRQEPIADALLKEGVKLPEYLHPVNG